MQRERFSDLALQFRALKRKFVATHELADRVALLREIRSVVDETSEMIHEHLEQVSRRFILRRPFR
jgi:hypothetical protein